MHKWANGYEATCQRLVTKVNQQTNNSKRTNKLMTNRLRKVWFTIKHYEAWHCTGQHVCVCVCVCVCVYMCVCVCVCVPT